jgi:hypothetical protein
MIAKEILFTFLVVIISSPEFPTVGCNSLHQQNHGSSKKSQGSIIDFVTGKGGSPVLK